MPDKICGILFLETFQWAQLEDFDRVLKHAPRGLVLRAKPFTVAEHGIWRLGRSVLELSEVPARVAFGDLMTRLLWGALVE
jgi:hypothetical protein